MFRPRPDGAPTLVAVTVEGRLVHVPAGASAAAAVLAAGFRSIRETPVTGAERAPYCMTGVCFDCLAEIDGVANRQSCMVEVRAGMRIRRQIGTRQAGAHQAGAHQAGAHQAGAHQAGAHQAGAHQAGAHQAGAHQAGAHQAGAHQAGARQADPAV